MSSLCGGERGRCGEESSFIATVSSFLSLLAAFSHVREIHKTLFVRKAAFEKNWRLLE